MVNIELTPFQAEELKHYYTRELEKINNEILLMKQRADEISTFISKLQANTAGKTTTPLKPVVKVVAPKKLKSIKSNTKIKKDKLDWTSFAFQVIQSFNRPVTTKEIFSEYEMMHGATFEKPEVALQSLRKALYRLNINYKKIDKLPIEGTNEVAYAMPGNSKKIAAETPAVNMTEKLDSADEASSPAKAVQAKKEKPAKKESKQFKWSEFVFETLKKNKRVMSAREFIKFASVHFDATKENQDMVKRNLPPILSRLERITKTLKTTKKRGSVGRFYGLPEWFSEDGKLIVLYK